jgi:PAS domain S-box-containing protein
MNEENLNINIPGITAFSKGNLAALYATIIEDSNDAIVSKSIDSIVQSWNKGAELLFGYTAEEAIGRHISFLLPEDRLAEEDEIIRKLKKKEKISHFETERKRKDGTLINVSVTISPIVDKEGNVIGASKIARDITDKTAKEQEELKHKERLKKQTNEILEVLLSYVLKDFSSVAPVSDIGDEIDAFAVGLNTLGEELKESLEANQNYIQLLEDLNVNLERIVANRTTELAQYKYAIDQSSIVEITDTNGVMIHVNDNKLAITQYTRDEMIGQNTSMVNSGFHSKEFIAEMWNTIKEGKIWKGEFRNRAKDGTNYWVDTTIVPFTDEEGNIYQYMGIKTDITENKNNELDLAERTKEIESVNKELESFSYSVSHDLRAPLRAINGYALMLEEDFGPILNAEGNRLIGVIRDNAQHMGQLIDDLLNFSRLGRKEIKKAMVNMQELTEGILREIRADKNFKANIEVYNLHPAMADQSLLYNVMANLISNAVKYSSKVEYPKVVIASEKKENETIFYVKDNGAGFEMEYANKLFGVFQRLHTSDEFEGTGVGLATVQRIIHKHGGHVWAEGKVNEGATFYFSLPN